MALSDIALIFIQMIVYFWSFITWPFYFIYYGPWKRTRNFKRKRATQVDIKTDEVTYRAKPFATPSHLRTILMNHEANIRTMDKGNRIIVLFWIKYFKNIFDMNIFFWIFSLVFSICGFFAPATRYLNFSNIFLTTTSGSTIVEPVVHNRGNLKFKGN